MNLPSEPRAQGLASCAEAIGAFAAQAGSVGPFEFRLLAGEDVDAVTESQDGSNGHGRLVGAGRDSAAREDGLRKAVDAARQEGLQQGDREGRRAARAELEAEMRTAVAQELERLVRAVEQFRAARERYFVEVEQEVVKLALAIAARVLHREAQIDPLLLTGAVRVALEKMADRTGVVVRVAAVDVAAWEQAFAATEVSERPRVTGDAGLARGECRLETRMGTVELGVPVQLEEIEKGFFDLLNHRPVE
jgi:flagellar assembly protein FliH